MKWTFEYEHGYPLSLVFLSLVMVPTYKPFLMPVYQENLPPQVVSVISNKADAYGLVRARNAGVEAIYFPKRENESRREYDLDSLTTCPPVYLTT